MNRDIDKEPNITPKNMPDAWPHPGSVFSFAPIILVSGGGTVPSLHG